MTNSEMLTSATRNDDLMDVIVPRRGGAGSGGGGSVAIATTNGIMLPSSSTTETTTTASTNVVFGSQLIDQNSKTPYSDATKVNTAFSCQYPDSHDS